MTNSTLLEAKSIVKNYGGVQALKDANITIRRGEIHALLGQNGSGKSTLMKILSGQAKQDAGTIYIKGEEVNYTTPHQALQFGISMVAQEISLVKELSVAENIMLGRHIRVKSGRFIDWKETYRKAVESLKTLGLEIDPRVRVSALSIDLQQIVEITRAVSTGSEIIILDEPTSSLTAAQSVYLFNLLQKLKRQGKAVIFISHKINEILENCDRVTILRDGTTTGEELIKNTDARKLVNLMIGREVGDFYYKEKVNIGENVLELKSLSLEPYFQNVNLQLKKGQIVGLYGLESAGHKELLETIFGLKKKPNGTIMMHGKEVQLTTPQKAIESGIAYVPPDRKVSGGVLQLSVTENLLMVKNATNFSLGLESWTQKRKKVMQTFEDFQIRGGGLQTKLGLLSGGNQQKVVVGKWVNVSPFVFLLNDPTRGVDIPAKKEMYQILARLARNGTAILIISSDLPELLALSDYVYVMFQGRIVKEMDNTSRDVSSKDVMYYATGNYDNES